MVSWGPSRWMSSSWWGWVKPRCQWVLATLCCPIRSLTTKGKFRLDNSVIGWSSGPNEMSTSDHFIFLFGSMHWARLLSLSSFSPCVFEAMDRMPPKITLISSIWSSLSIFTRRCSPRRGSCATWGWHLLTIQKSLALLQIVSCGVMDLTPLLCIIIAIKWHLLLLLCEMQLAVSTILRSPCFLRFAVLTSWSSYCFFLGRPLLHESRSRAQALKASKQTSATVSRSAIILGFSMVISSTVLMSLALSWKTLMTLMS
jgi:hypothetical protein